VGEELAGARADLLQWTEMVFRTARPLAGKEVSGGRGAGEASCAAVCVDAGAHQAEVLFDGWWFLLDDSRLLRGRDVATGKLI
jgi:hypothetical protein